MVTFMLFAYDTVNKNLSPKPGEQPKLPIPASLVAGACAGVSSTLVTYPLELLKTRLTIQRGVYDGLFDAFIKILQEGGLGSSTEAQLQAIRRDFETLQMKNGESSTDYCGRVMKIANNMQIHCEKIADGAIVEKILRSIAPKFDFIVCSIEEANDIDEMSINELKSTLLVHKQKLNRGPSKEQALKASTFVESLSSRRRG
ncbi:hypothetical protein F0562_007290 [Nyssa sinensis]|uniref:Uncharacterized protein n=1 Tax=Nyssa sinensis TaxID=561372 RepID=A0A5J5A3G6_9ASTE|nr:hypothetical protein F0562_007290 [Nyssa sinensis]